MVNHNNVVPSGNFKKHWQNYVKKGFNQPARKKRRCIGNTKKHAYFPFFKDIIDYKEILFVQHGHYPFNSSFLTCDFDYLVQLIQKKVVKIFACPTTSPLQPIVHGKTQKYNIKVLEGREFSLEELKVRF